MIIASASLLDRSNQEELDKYNEMMDAYRDMVAPKAKEMKQKEAEKMEQMFNSLFKDKEIKPIQMSAGDVVSPDAEFKNKKIKDLVN